MNTEFINLETGKHIPLERAIKQIRKGNPNYKEYEAVDLPNGTTYVRSKPDNSKSNNIVRAVEQ